MLEMPQAALSDTLAPACLDPKLVSSTEEHYELLQQLVDQEPGLVHFFVGAGISRSSPSEMPLSSEFQGEVLKRLNSMSTQFNVALTRLTTGDLARRVTIEALPLETLFQFLKDLVLGDVLTVCDVYRSSSEERLWNVSHRFLAAWMAQGYGPVITVNIDHLIEDAFTSITTEVTGRIYADLGRFSPQLERGKLYKLHGTVEEKGTLRMTLDRVAPNLPAGAKRLFLSFTRGGPLCLVGWAGADLDLRPLLIEGTRSSGYPVFYVIHAAEKPTYGGERRDGEPSTEEGFRRKNPKAFELIDAIGALPLYTTAERLFQMLGEHALGWPCH